MTLTALNVDRTVSPSRNLLARKGAPVDSSVDEVVHLKLYFVIERVQVLNKGN